MHFSFATTLGLLTLAIAAPTTSTRHVVHERRDKLPNNWKKSSPLQGDVVVPMRIALTQSNLDKAHEFLIDVSHPDSPNYGKHWNAKQVAETFAPSDDSVRSVLQWLAESGITGDRVRQSQSLNWIHANVTVIEAEALLQTKYHIYTHSISEQAHIACEDYSIPQDIQEHIDFITPTIHFDAKVIAPKQRRSLDEKRAEIAKRQTSTDNHTVAAGVAKAIGSPIDGSLPKGGERVPENSDWTTLENCDEAIVPDCLRALYSLPHSLPANPKSKS